MATVDDKKLIDEIIAKDGYYEDDPRVYMIVEYTNSFGNKTWGVTWSNQGKAEREKYLLHTAYVRTPRILWCSDVPNPKFCRNPGKCFLTKRCYNIEKYDRSCND